MKTFLKVMLILGLVGLIAAGTLILYGFNKYGRGLPDHKQLANYSPPVVTRLYAGDGRLMAEYAQEKRVFVPIDAIPPLVVHAFLAAEDQDFFNHGGIDLWSVIRAAVFNLNNKLHDDSRRQGGSTITQQVAKNFLLTNEKSLERKIKEAILAFRIESVLSKPRILELYLNEIYLGIGSYGVAAAALNYFNHSLDELTPAEVAYLAALPKAPNNYHPVRRLREAIARRNWVLEQMYKENYIDRATLESSQREPFTIRRRDAAVVVKAEAFAEDTRRWLKEHYGESELYGGGYAVRTTLDPHLQSIGERVFRQGVVNFDRQRGWRGVVTSLDMGNNDAVIKLGQMDNGYAEAGWDLALLTAVNTNTARLITKAGDEGSLDADSVKWTKSSVSKILKKGDVIYVSRRQLADNKTDAVLYDLQQAPLVNGGLMAMDPHTGRVLAMVGGFNYRGNQFNRATQALRQPGSTFKPMVYLAALERGYKPNTIVNDAPVTLSLGAGRGSWTPGNYENKYSGPTSFRIGMEKSKNLMTLRIALSLGMQPIQDITKRFGIYDNLEPYFAAVLGSYETTLMKMVNAYAQIVNGGKKITPTLIDRIQDRNGKTIYRHDGRICADCSAHSWNSQDMPQLPDTRPQITDPASAYQMVSIMQGVVQRGTGQSIGKALPGYPLAGKTGTTNDHKDMWFIGFSPDLVVGLYIGFDQPKPMGRLATGGMVCAPIFRDFMLEAMKDKPATPFRIPPDIKLVRVNHDSGTIAWSDAPGTILEAFKKKDDTHGGRYQNPDAQVQTPSPDAVPVDQFIPPDAGGDPTTSGVNINDFNGIY